MAGWFSSWWEGLCTQPCLLSGQIQVCTPRTSLEAVSVASSFYRGTWGYMSNECLSWRGWVLYEHNPAVHPLLCSGHKASAEGIMRHVDCMHSPLPRSLPPYREKRSTCLCCWKAAKKDVEINQECRELRSDRCPSWSPSFVQSVSSDSGAYCTSAPAKLPLTSTWTMPFTLAFSGFLQKAVAAVNQKSLVTDLA